MNIIFGDPTPLKEKYTVLELDTFRSPTTNETMTAYCLVDVIPLADMPTASNWIQIHSDLMQAYRQRHWNYCRQAIEGLTGKWNKDLDSFYSDLLGRINEYENNPPSTDWDGSILKELRTAATAS